MSVTITDPLDNDEFPDPNAYNWTVTATIDSADSLDGLLYDYTTGELYMCDDPTCINGPDENGLYTWELSFSDTTGIREGDALFIYVYDEATGDGASVAVTASMDGGLNG